MSIWTRGLVAAGLACALSMGCKKDSETQEPKEEKSEEQNPEDPPREDETGPEEAASLWRLAPARARGGVVLRSGAAARLAAGLQTLRESYERLPDAEARLAMLEKELENPADFPLLKPETWDQAGLDLSRPAAMFFFDDGGVIVLPVADRDAFVKAVGGSSEGEGAERVDELDDARCKELDGHYVCVSEEALFDEVGEGGDLATAGAERPKRLRGDIEVDADPEDGEEDFERMQVGVRLGRGAATLRMSFEADTSEVPPVFAVEPKGLTEGMAEASPSGFLRLHLALGMAAMAAPSEPTPFGVTAKELVSALTGEFVAYSLAGDEPSGYVKVGVSKPKLYRSLLAKLCPMLASELPWVDAKLDEGRCAGTVSAAKAARAAGEEVPSALPFDELTFEIGVDDDAATVALNDPEENGRPSSSRTGSGRELMEGEWNMALWGAGGLSSEALAPIHDIPHAPKEIVQTASWLLLHLNEIGFGVRMESGRAEVLLRVGTQWANPDEVLEELEPLLARAAQGEDVSEEMAALADGHPDTPLGRSLSGEVGLVPVAAAMGMASAIAVPAFVKYTKKSKTTEAQVFLQKMHEGARAHYMERPPGKARFPKPSVGPTPPKGACCKGEGDKCQPDAAQWTNATWTALQFSVVDPHYYSYEYEVAPDGKSFTASAYGDLDCDGEYATFRMIGEAGPDGLKPGAPMLRIKETE